MERKSVAFVTVPNLDIRGGRGGQPLFRARAPSAIPAALIGQLSRVTDGACAYVISRGLPDYLRGSPYH